MSRPVVSICIPAYENPASLVRLLDSILKQSFQDFEIVVSDDSPGDLLTNLIHSYADPRIRYFHNSVPLGSPENWNQAIAHASGVFVKVMHHDDWFASSLSLERMVSVMKEKSADMLFAQAMNMSTDGILSVNSPRMEDVRKMLEHPFSLFFQNIIGAPSATLYKKGILKYDRNLRWFVDVEFYSSMISSGAVVEYLPEELICIGVDGPRVTNEYESNFANVAEEFFYSWYKCKRDGRLFSAESYYWLYKFFKMYHTLRWRDFCPYLRVLSVPMAFVLWIVLKVKMAIR
jgi:Glycosyltransferases involved in cell wall biogenesis